MGETESGFPIILGRDSDLTLPFGHFCRKYLNAKEAPWPSYFFLLSKTELAESLSRKITICFLKDRCLTCSFFNQELNWKHMKLLPQLKLIFIFSDTEM